jgi:hypothetical protein
MKLENRNQICTESKSSKVLATFLIDMMKHSTCSNGKGRRDLAPGLLVQRASVSPKINEMVFRLHRDVGKMKKKENVFEHR